MNHIRFFKKRERVYMGASYFWPFNCGDSVLVECLDGEMVFHTSVERPQLIGRLVVDHHRVIQLVRIDSPVEHITHRILHWLPADIGIARIVLPFYSE